MAAERAHVTAEVGKALANERNHIQTEVGRALNSEKKVRLSSAILLVFFENELASCHDRF